ncbi:MAG: hypothetical protein HYX66_08910 [Ignavibacteria bacterium]|nr:hypothetical protein [Ignavibacteria bacterium]
MSERRSPPVAFGKTRFERLNDVVITNPQQGDVPTYDAAISKWTNQTQGGSAVTDGVLANDYTITFAGGKAMSVMTPAGDAVYRLELFFYGEYTDIGQLFASPPAAYMTLTTRPAHTTVATLRRGAVASGGVKVYPNGVVPVYNSSNDLTFIDLQTIPANWWGSIAAMVQTLDLYLVGGTEVALFLKLSANIPPSVNEFWLAKAGSTIRLTRLWELP